MPSLVIRGAVGSIHWAYHRAADVTDWAITTTPAGLTLTATVREADTFRLSQSALTFRVSRQNGPAWTWPILELHIADGAALTAALGPQE